MIYRMKDRNLKHLIIPAIALMLLLTLLLSLAKADIIVSGGGGSTNITVSPFQFSSPFSGPEVPGEEVPPEEVPPTGPGGGAGGVTGFVISVNPTQFNINMLINTNVKRTISVTNVGTLAGTAYVFQSGLDNKIILGNTSISLASGEKKDISVIFVAPDTPGVYNGTIYIGTRAIPVSLNVLKEFILFDSNIVVLNKNYEVPQGDPLRTEVTLIPMGAEVRMDVTLNYVIKDINGKIFLTKSETLLIESQKSIKRNFDTGGLPIGKYIIELELVYPYGVAPSSAHFDVVKNAKDTFTLVIYWVMILIILTLMAIIILIIIRTVRKSYSGTTAPEQNASAY
jgi:hypothetical protein